jgi:hypothetical protein
MLTAWGVLFALWNLREVLIDHWAISQVQHRPVAVLKLQTRGEVWNHALILVALASDCIVLSFTQTQRRRHIFNAIRLRRPQSDGLEQTK